MNKLNKMEKYQVLDKLQNYLLSFSPYKEEFLTYSQNVEEPLLVYKRFIILPNSIKKDSVIISNVDLTESELNNLVNNLKIMVDDVKVIFYSHQ